MEANIGGVTVGTASTLVVADSRNQSIEAKSIILTNAGSADAFVSRGVDAELNKGSLIKANGGALVISERAGLPVYAIATSGTTLITFSVV